MGYRFIQILEDYSNPSSHPCIAFIGGGGKSSLISQLGRELSQIYSRVALTSLTKSGTQHTEAVCLPDRFRGPELISHFALANPLKIFRKSPLPEKYEGISREELFDIRNIANICLFECDGARKKPLKIHTKDDPKVPEFADQVIVVVGADVVGTSPEGGLVHRAGLFCDFWDIASTKILDVDFISMVVTSKRGYGSKIPDRLGRSYFVNKADDHGDSAQALAQAINERTRDAVYMGSVHQGMIRRVG